MKRKSILHVMAITVVLVSIGSLVGAPPRPVGTGLSIRRLFKSTQIKTSSRSETRTLIRTGWQPCWQKARSSKKYRRNPAT
jgi:hypothetical protein